jgi:hypothetical protein
MKCAKACGKTVMRMLIYRAARIGHGRRFIPDFPFNASPNGNQLRDQGANVSDTSVMTSP